jgi:hypothetical protein
VPLYTARWTGGPENGRLVSLAGSPKHFQFGEEAFDDD